MPTFAPVASYQVLKHDGLNSLGFYLAAFLLCGYLLYLWLLPKPISGIPYNEQARRHILGDIPSLINELKKPQEDFKTWLLVQLQNLNSPIVQVFIRPLQQPVVVLSDFRESQDILMRRKEFDRADSTAEAFRGLIPHHHIRQSTNAIWKAQRRLLQDLMSPAFLHDVVGSVIHANALNLIKLWELKAIMADGRPFSAYHDVHSATLDSVLGFAFGEDFPQSAVGPDLALLKTLDGNAKTRILSGVHTDDEPVIFPVAPRQDSIAATLDLCTAMEEIAGRPFQYWKWKYIVTRKPKISRASATKNHYVQRELENAAVRLQTEESHSVRSAVDHMVQREKKMAEKDGRTPDYVSPVMADEVRIYE
jgi:hypothetical protein